MAWPLAIPLIQAAAMIGGQLLGNRANRKAAEWSNEQNVRNTNVAYDRQMELMRFQMDYNSPANQMARFRAAGLNPNLIYGQGSPGNVSVPDVPKTPSAHRTPNDYAGIMNAGMMLAQMKLMESQTDLTNARTEESTIKQDLLTAQAQVTRANPYLQEGYVSSLVSQLKATATMKEQEAKFKTETIAGFQGDTEYLKPVERGMVMMEQQLNNLFTKYKIDQQRSSNLDQDLKIKAEILQSKEFANDLSKIQVEWMKNADITPQHIYQAIFMILQSMMRR